MLKIAFIFTIGLLPAFLSQVFWRRVEQRSRDRLYRAINRPLPYTMPPRTPTEARDVLEESIAAKQWLGDANCRFCARSPYLRCAVNPEGPCEGCLQFQPNSYPSSVVYIVR